MPIVKNAIQAVVPRNIMAIATARKTIPIGRNAAPPPLLARPFDSDVGSDLADLLRQFGHSQVDFTVVGSGPNGANPHHEIGPRIIEDGDMVAVSYTHLTLPTICSV